MIKKGCALIENNKRIKKKNNLFRGVKTRIKIEIKSMGWNEFTTTNKTKGRIVNKKQMSGNVRQRTLE